MIQFNRLFLVSVLFLFLLTGVSASVDTVVIQFNGQNYDHAVIGKTYDLFVAGTDLQTISDSELQILSNDGSLANYQFNPGNIAGTRIFGTGANEFSIVVLSEADELASSIESVVLEVTDTSSSINVNNMDLSQKIIRNFNFDLDEFQGLIDLNNLLNGFDFDLEFAEGSTHPDYNSLSIDGGSSAGTVVGSILIFNNLAFDVNAINANPILLDQVIDKYNADIEYGFDARAIKQNKNFEFSSEEGYANLGGTDIENLQQIIEDKIKFINPDEVIDALVPIGNFSEFKRFVTFNTSVNSSGLRLEDGTYQLELIYTDQFGNSGTKPFTVILDVTNTGENTVNNTGVVTFTNVVIIQTLQRVENLPPTVNLTAVLYGNARPFGFANSPSNVRSLNYINISSSNSSATDNGAFDLYFKVAKTLIPSSAKNDVKLYVQEGNAWTLLPTFLISETSTDYEYRAIIPHFSNFLIGYGVESSGGGGNSQVTEYSGIKKAPIPPASPQNPIPINLTPPPEAKGFFASITGAVIGALGTGGSIVVAVFMISIVTLAVVFGLRGRPGKKKKLNEKSDNDEE